MRIAEISTVARPVPPNGEGSIEQIVSLQTEELVRSGHEVTLFALPESRTRATLQSPVEFSYTDPASNTWDWQTFECINVRAAFLAARDFDVIHCHSYHYGLYFADFVDVPSLHSVHINPSPDLARLYNRSRNGSLLFCSEYQAREFAGLPRVHVIPHGIDFSHFAVNPTASRDYFAFLGRFIPEKGALEAIQVARATGIPLKMAAPPNDYFEREIMPHIDGTLIQYMGELDLPAKRELLAGARALIYPLQTAEAFGLVLVEAMACGTPVLALNLGAVAEIVDHGRTGLFFSSMDDLIRAAKQLPAFNAAEIRASAQARFTHIRMADELESLLQRLVEHGK